MFDLWYIVFVYVSHAEVLTSAAIIAILHEGLALAYDHVHSLRGYGNASHYRTAHHKRSPTNSKGKR